MNRIIKFRVVVDNIIQQDILDLTGLPDMMITLSKENRMKDIILEQFIGLQDCKGVDIYFNDIMETADKRHFIIFECLGDLKNGMTYFGIAVRFENGNEYPFDYSLLKSEVIGNVHKEEKNENS